MKRPSEIWLTACIVVLAVPAHLIGLLTPSIYRDPAVLLPQNLGTDIVTLCVGIPLLGLAGLAMRRGSLRGRLLWLGALGYLVYAYGMYALGVRWTPLFLVYVALFGLSLFAIIIGLVGTDAERLRAAFSGHVPVRSVASYLIGIAVIVAALWLGEEVKALLSGTLPPSVVQFETPTNIVHVFDLAFVLPALLIAGVMVLRGQAWGYVFAGVVLVKAATIGLWVAVMTWFSARQGFATPPAYTAFFLTLTALGVGLAWRFLRALGGRHGWQVDFEPGPAGPTRRPRSSIVQARNGRD